MSKVISMEEAVAKLSDGMSLMIGGFMGCGNAHHLVQAVIDAGLKDLTMISNDAAMPGYGIAKLVEHRRLRRLVTSHVGLNPEVGVQMNSGELEVELVPQGTLVERIRSGGAGLGGVLTPTGIGTPVAEGKPVITVDGKDYLLEQPLRADVALLNGYRVDPDGNVWYRGDARNFNPVMATAADLVIVEADHLVERGEIPPEDVVTPGVFVDYIVVGGEL